MAITATALQGCASTGTVATVGPGPVTTPTAPATPTDSTSTPATPAPPTDTSTSAPSTPAPPVTSSSAAPSTPAPGPGGWTPAGDLAKAEPIDEVVNPDKSVTATWPKGAQPGHALVVKLRAARNGGKIVIALNIDNESGKQVSMNEGMFTGGVVVDAQGTSLTMEEFDPLWTLGTGNSDGGGDGDLHPGQPLVGNFVVDAPAAGSTLNAYWAQATQVDGIMNGIILIRDIPIN